MKLLICSIICSLATLSFGQTPSYVSTTGLVGWWPFNGNAIDESANTNNGTVNGATLTIDRFGNTNQAYIFDGINDFINLPSGTSTTLNVIGNYSLSLWMKTNQTSYGSQVTFADNMVSTGGFLFNHRTPNNPNNLSYYTGNGWNSTGCNLNNDTWIHFVIVTNGNSLNIYRNGVLCFTNNNIVPCTSWNGPRMFGVSSQGNIGFYTGILDDIALWNRVLAPCEISDLYHSQLNWLQVSAGNDINTCIGNSVTLSGLGNSSQYTWNNGATNNLPFTPTISGSTSYTVTGTDPSGCVAIDVSTVTVNPIPLVNAGIDQTVCTGNTVTLSGNGATTYSWNNGVSNGVGFNPTVSNDYIVMGTDINGCQGTDTVSLTVINVSSSILTETALDSYTLNGQTYTQSGTYTQVIPNAAGCDSTITLDLTLQYTGIEELKNDILVYPNPSASYLTIESNWIQNEEFVILDMQGREIKKGIFSTSKEKIDLKNVAIGNYILRIGAKEIKISKE
jgi:hypothetical protein